MFSTAPKTWTLKHWELIYVKEREDYWKISPANAYGNWKRRSNRERKLLQTLTIQYGHLL